MPRFFFIYNTILCNAESIFYVLFLFYINNVELNLYGKNSYFPLQVLNSPHKNNIYCTTIKYTKYIASILHIKDHKEHISKKFMISGNAMLQIWKNTSFCKCVWTAFKEWIMLFITRQKHALPMNVSYLQECRCCKKLIVNIKLYKNIAGNV